MIGVVELPGLARTLRAAQTVLLVLATLLCCPVDANELPTGVKRGAQVEGVNEYHLANGLKVLLIAEPSAPSVTVSVTYLVGARLENYGESGMAHLLEHLLFKGTPSRPSIAQELGKRGMRPNATTHEDRTVFFETFAPSDESLDWALAMEADRMVNARISAVDLAAEMPVVRNEWEDGENAPQRVLYEKILATAFQWHHYGKTVIGARSDIEHVDIARLHGFYQTFYQPDNAMLVVAGRFDEALALARIAQHFGAGSDYDVIAERRMALAPLLSRSD